MATQALEIRRSQLVDVLMQKTEWVVTRPKRVVVILGVLGLLMRIAWLNLLPLDSGDQGWPTVTRLKTFFPWPTIWDPTHGLGGSNATFNAFRFPVYAFQGFLAHLGAHWAIIERVVYYLPDAILVPIAGWYIAREILGDTRWSIMGALLYSSSTYLIIEGNGEVPLALGAVMGTFTIVAYLRLMKRPSLRMAIYTGLLMGATSITDIRPAYVTALMMTLYLLLRVAAHPTRRHLFSRVWVSFVAAVVYLLTQMFWILPLIASGATSQLPIPSAPDFNIATLLHGLTGVIAWWTGSNPAQYSQSLLNPLFVVLPMVAMMVLIRKKLSVEIVWLALTAAIFAFLAKTNTPPFGAVYNWIFTHVIGFNLFREGSKFLYPVLLAYAVLIPASLQVLGEKIKISTLDLKMKLFFRSVQLGSLTVIIGVSAACIVALENGSLLSTTVPTIEPTSFSQLTQILNKDKTPGQVAWFGASGFISSNGVIHGYNIASPTHPLQPLVGSSQSIVPQADDPFQNFCTVHSQFFCYLNPAIFPYLVQQSNITYIVSPAGSSEGNIMGGVTPGWLKDQISSMYGRPTLLGSGPTSIYYWHLNTKTLPVANYNAVGLVNSGPWSLENILPALKALDIPAVYRGTYSEATLPGAPAQLPESIGISPYFNQQYSVANNYATAILANSNASTLTVKSGSTVLNLNRLAVSKRDVGWSFYGPLTLKSGKNSVISTDPSVSLGPLVQWSSLTQTSLQSSPSPVTSVHFSSNSEKISVNIHGKFGPWQELRINYDSGWQLSGNTSTVLGSGLFNMFHINPGASNTPLVLQYVTLPWEHIGLLVALLTLIACVITLNVIRKRSHRVDLSFDDYAFVEFPVSQIGSTIGALAVAFLGLTFLAQAYAWFGIPSEYPWASISSDPYALDTSFASMSIGLIILSVIVRVIEPAFGRRLAHVFRLFSGKIKVKRQSVAVVTMSALVLSACNIGSTQSVTQLLGDAGIAGSASSKIIGSSLNEARQNYVALNPVRCIQDYTNALNTFPNMASIYAGRAACYDSRGVYLTEAAMSDTLRAAQLAPNNLGILFQLGTTYLSVGYTAQGVSTFETLANLPNSNVVIIQNVIDQLDLLHKFQDASTILQIALTKFPLSSSTYLAASDMANAQNNETAVFSNLAKARALALPGSSAAGRVDSFACSLEVSRHEYSSAIADCSNAILYGQTGAGVWENLAAAEADLGNFTLAIKDSSNALSAFESGVGPYAQSSGVGGYGISTMLVSQGQFYVEIGDAKKATADFNLALSNLPPDVPDTVQQIQEDMLYV